MAVNHGRTLTGKDSFGHPASPESSRALVKLVPGIDRRLDEEDRCRISRLRVPVHTAFEGPFDLGGRLRAGGAFALVIAEGMMLRTFALAAHTGLQLLGPGDIINRPGEEGPELISGGSLQARGIVRYALLDDRVLALARHSPRLIEGLQMSGEEQQQRLLAQMLICQLPRVEDRVQAILWLLAETWGRVTPSGTVLPMRLTHDAIGQLVGSRRSTVTLALRALEERDAILRRAHDWLLLEPPVPAGCSEPVRALPSVISTTAGSPWAACATGTRDGAPTGTVTWLRDRREAIMRESRERIATARSLALESKRLAHHRARRRSGGRIHHEDGAGDLSIVPDGTDG